MCAAAICRMPMLGSLLFLAGFLTRELPGDEPDDTKEPPLQFRVELNGRSIELTEGAAFQVEGQFQNPTVSVTPLPYRIFTRQRVSFRYPRSFTFEADLDNPASRTWTLSGNDFNLMLFDVAGDLTPHKFAANMAERFGKDNASITNTAAEITLGNQVFPGVSLHMSVVQHRMMMDVYRILGAHDRTTLLVFQDSRDDEGNRSLEGTNAIRQLSASFAVLPDN